MKPITFLFFLFSVLCSHAQTEFDKFFTSNTMRVDFVFAGNATNEQIYLHQIKKEPYWGGPKINLIDNLDYGEYKFELWDVQSGSLIYSKGFCTLFEEWQTTDEAKLVDKSFFQTIIFPYPQQQVLLKLYSRLWEGDFKKIFETTINPGSYFVQPEIKDYAFEKILDNGDPSAKVDLVFLAEGYTAGEMDKFKSDSRRMMDYVFSQVPFNQQKNNFNVWIVMCPSEESGTDIPGQNVYRKTILNSNFYTFDSERYLTTTDVLSVRDAAAVVPYDDICILVNSDKYGGGGIYNHYAISTIDHYLSEKVFIHEFGHSFAGLGDEYYTSSTSYNDFFNLNIEPWQPNLTTLVNFELKWKEKVGSDTPIPTPREKKYESTIGVFEGGGYVSKGMYSPFQDCRMKSNEAEGFCPVCQDAIIKMILFKTN